MNIFEKIQAVKSDLNKMGLKKSGKNKYSSYMYYELADFLPAIVEKCAEYKLMTYVSFTADNAILTAVNSEKPEEHIEVMSPMKELQMKGCNEVQALGGAETYQRRYLYMAMFDIVENDMFDSGAPQDSKENKTVEKTPSAARNDDSSKTNNNTNVDDIPPYQTELRKIMNNLVKSKIMTKKEILEKLEVLSREKSFKEYTETECKIAIDFLNGFVGGDNNE